MLEIDTATERFREDAVANEMLFRPGRADYVFPEEA
jgi:hypothetical protein